MSLRELHMVFITVCVVFCFGFSIWSLSAEDGYRSLGWFSLLLGAGLIVYGVNAFKKLSLLEKRVAK